MGFAFNADYSYEDGKSGNFVLQCLQNEKGILNKFDEFVYTQLALGKNSQFLTLDDFLEWCWGAYIVTRSTGVKTDTPFPFINTGHLATKTKVTYFED